VTAAAAACAAVLVATGGQAVAASPATPPPTDCIQVIRINSLAFDPAEVSPGGFSDAVLTATNCTGLSQDVTEQWSGRWLAASATGLPTGCPVIDPLIRRVAFEPYAQVSTDLGYTVFPGCTADVLRVTVTLSEAGTQLAQASANLIIDQPAVS
jgi:hypothetical protein